MGSTNNIKEVLQKHELKARSCHSCSKPFTSYDIEIENWTLEYRTNSDTDWSDFPLREGRGWIALEVALYHIECEDTNEVSVNKEEVLTKRPSREYDKN